MASARHVVGGNGSCFSVGGLGEKLLDLLAPFGVGEVQHYEEQLAAQRQHYEEQLAEQKQHYEEQLAAQKQHYEEQLEGQLQRQHYGKALEPANKKRQHYEIERFHLGEAPEQAQKKSRSFPLFCAGDSFCKAIKAICLKEGWPPECLLPRLLSLTGWMENVGTCIALQEGDAHVRNPTIPMFCAGDPSSEIPPDCIGFSKRFRTVWAVRRATTSPTNADAAADAAEAEGGRL